MLSFTTITCLLGLTFLANTIDAEIISFVVSAKGLKSGDSENVGTNLLNQITTLTNVKSPQFLQHAQKSDPYLLIYKSGFSGSYNRILVEKSRTLQNNNDPFWNDVFTFTTWKKGSGQKLYFTIMDHDLVDGDDHMGEASIILDEYMEKGQKETVRLSKGGYLTIRKPSPVYFRLSVRELPSKDRLGVNDLSDPYVVVYLKEGDKLSKIHTTSPGENVREFDYQDVIIFNGYEEGTDQELVFKVIDHDTVGRDESLGKVTLNLDRFTEEIAAEKTLELPELGGKVIVKKYSP